MSPAAPHRTGRASDGRVRSTRRRLLRLWAVSSLAFFALGVLWALATPIGAAPDEPTQIVKAAAVVRGQLTGTAVRRQPEAVVRVREPVSFADGAHLATCYAGRPSVPAGCAPRLPTSSRTVSTETYVGRYPPLYYLLVGTPTLLWRGDGAVYGVRVLSALWAAVLLGLAVAVAALWSRSRLLVPALAVAVTPMAVFLTGVVNPSGLEIAAAVATWTCGLVLVLDHRHHPPPGLVVATGAAASVLVLCRGLSPLWLALVAAALALLAPGGVSALWRHRAVRRAAAGTAVALAAALVFIVSAHTLSVMPVGRHVPRRSSDFQLVVDALGQTGLLLREAVGDFGWLDTPSPTAVLLGWWMAIGMVVTLGLVWSRRRHARVLVAVMAVAVVVPTLIMTSQAHHDGLVWQARDGLPFYVGIPLLAGAIAGRDHDRRAAAQLDARSTAAVRRGAHRLALLVAVGVAAGQWTDLVWALRRYTVGLGRTLAPWADVRGGWRPPLPVVLLFVAGLVVAAAYGWWVLQLTDLATERALATARVAVPPAAPRRLLGADHRRADTMVSRLFPALAGPPRPADGSGAGAAGGWGGARSTSDADGPGADASPLEANHLDDLLRSLLR